jgi:hypothetical protein
MAGVAQLVRAPDCGSGCRRFNSGRSPHFSHRPGQDRAELTQRRLMLADSAQRSRHIAALMRWSPDREWAGLQCHPRCASSLELRLVVDHLFFDVGIGWALEGERRLPRQEPVFDLQFLPEGWSRCGRAERHPRKYRTATSPQCSGSSQRVSDREVRACPEAALRKRVRPIRQIAPAREFRGWLRSTA